MGLIRLARMIRRLGSDDTGATAAEYALIAALVAMVIIVAVIFLGGSVFGLFDNTGSSFASFMGGVVMPFGTFTP
jgi:pilus assembly protein Flp/PilA